MTMVARVGRNDGGVVCDGEFTVVDALGIAAAVL